MPQAMPLPWIMIYMMFMMVYFSIMNNMHYLLMSSGMKTIPDIKISSVKVLW